MPTAPAAPDAESLTTKALEAVSFLREETLKTMEGVSKIAERGSINFLQSLGGGLLIVAFVFKVLSRWRFGNAEFLSTPEFITVFVVSTILILAGAAMRVYQFQREQNAGRQVRNSGVELVAKAMDVGADLSKYEPPAKPSM